jgi:ribosomal protein S18 acetylase RimI-like enzyme
MAVTPPTYTLRTAVVADIDRLLAFWRVSAEGTDRADDRPSVERLLARDPEALILAVEGDNIVGSVIAGWDGWRCHLYRIGVREDRRQRGIARSLVAAAERRFAAQGARRVDAMVLEDNGLGQSAWTALGYVPQQAWRRWVRRLDAK